MTNSLADIIRRRIETLGPMDLGEYMALCLGHPQHGYYMTRDPFGPHGDFITAPEISQMFGEMIGLWLADLWIKFDRPDPFLLIECGPGRGTLMADIMRATAALPGFHQAAKLHLMEMSPILREAQSQKLSRYGAVWFHDFEALPASIPAFIVANEFLDALPVRQLVRTKGQWRERVVSLTGDGTFFLREKEADPSILAHVPHPLLKGGDEGIVEVSPVLNQYMKSVHNLLIKQKGIGLFIDYGHVVSAFGETVQAVRSHRFTSIFDTPGFADITAHVDFENILYRAYADGLIVHGPVTQGAFLKELGIEVRAEKLFNNANEAQKKEILDGLKRLIDTDQMGTLFKVLALCHDPAIDMAGFHEGL